MEAHLGPAAEGAQRAEAVGEVAVVQLGLAGQRAVVEGRAHGVVHAGLVELALGRLAGGGVFLADVGVPAGVEEQVLVEGVFDVEHRRVADARVAGEEAAEADALAGAVGVEAGVLAEVERVFFQVAHGHAGGHERDAQDLGQIALGHVAAAAEEDAADHVGGADVGCQGGADVTAHLEEGARDRAVPEGQVAAVGHQLAAVGHAELAQAPGGDVHERAGGEHVEERQVHVVGVDVLAAEGQLGVEVVLADARADVEAGLLEEGVHAALAAELLLLEPVGEAHQLEAAADAHLGVAARLDGALGQGGGREPGEQKGGGEGGGEEGLGRHGRFPLMRIGWALSSLPG
ncbi:hypothetical protein D3C72_820920 [compost metagenome]